jgi:hypothetical protein
MARFLQFKSVGRLYPDWDLVNSLLFVVYSFLFFCSFSNNLAFNLTLKMLNHSGESIHLAILGAGDVR